MLVSMLFPIKFDKELYTRATVKGNGGAASEERTDGEDDRFMLQVIGIIS